ncbi:MAG: hypothetical protein V3V59_09000, partial [Thermodesulfovibrionales bacterium]
EAAQFLRTLLSFLGAVTFVSFTCPMIRFLAHLKGMTYADRLVIRKSELAAGTAKYITYSTPDTFPFQLRTDLVDPLEQLVIIRA